MLPRSVTLRGHAPGASGRALGTEPLIADGAGHYPHLEMPERAAPQLLAFLARLGAP